MIIVPTNSASLPPVSRPVTWVSSSVTNGSTGSIPAHQAGDIILVCAFERSNGTRSPTLPAASGTVPAWTSTGAFAIGGFVAGWTVSGHSCWFRATSGSTTTGTFTNTNQVQVAVLRPSPLSTSVAVSRGLNGGGPTSSTSMTGYGQQPGVDSLGTDNSKAVCMFCSEAAISTGTMSGWTRAADTTYGHLEYRGSGPNGTIWNSISYSSASAALAFGWDVGCFS